MNILAKRFGRQLDFGATWFSEDRAMGGAALISWARARCFCFSADLADN